MKKEIKYKIINGTKIRYNKPSNRQLRRFIPVLELSKWEPTFDQKLFDKIYEIYSQNKSILGYCNYWHLEKLGIDKVFKCLKAYYLVNPYKIRFNVDRSGLNTYFKLL